MTVSSIESDYNPFRSIAKMYLYIIIIELTYTFILKKKCSLLKSTRIK